MPPPQPKPSLSKAIYVVGMHGRGDCLHSRAVLRQWIDQGKEVWLESSWVSLFWDLIETGKLHIVRKATPLRTQIKNARREAAIFDRQSPPNHARRVKIWYRPDQVRRCGSVLAALCEGSQVDFSAADFRLPIHPSWMLEVDHLFEEWKPTKPLMILRPPCERPEWPGAGKRNPDLNAYAEIYRSIRDRFFVVSVADFEQGKEWQPGPELPADVKYHKGELNSETLAALFSRADLVFTTGGFGVVLAQAVSTPVVAILGGYEDHRSYLGGARWTPYLGIDPIRPCQCFSHSHSCDKRIDVPKAVQRVKEFVDAL